MCTYVYLVKILEVWSGLKLLQERKAIYLAKKDSKVSSIISVFFFLLLNTCYICFKKQYVYLVTPDVSKTRQGQRNQKWTHTTVVYLTCQVLVSTFTDWH